MAPISLADIVSGLPADESWGPPTATDNTLDGVPYAPYSKGDKLGRMADWTTEGKDGRDGRGGRQQYNRNYRGQLLAYHISFVFSFSLTDLQTNKYTAPAHPAFSPYKSLKTSPPSP